MKMEFIVSFKIITEMWKYLRKFDFVFFFGENLINKYFSLVQSTKNCNTKFIASFSYSILQI